jgi:hypothetical protein
LNISAYPNDENINNLDENIKLTKENNVYNCPTFDYFVTVLIINIHMITKLD